MSNRTHRMRAVASAALAVVAIAACGGSSGSASTVRSTTSSTAPDRPTAPIDTIVRVDGGGLHVRCVGEGSTTIVLIAGWGDGGESWGAIEPELAAEARVCSYARFGTGTSDPPASTQTFSGQALELRTLLRTIDEPGPYVVVGHSFGGAQAVAFASLDPNEVAGLLLLDATPIAWPAAICAVPDDGSQAAADLRMACASMRDPAANPERLDVIPAFAAVARIDSLGALPLVVMSAAHLPLPGLAPAEAARLADVRTAGAARWASLSSSARIVSVADTGHHIQLDQPEVVVRAVLGLLP